MYWRGLLVDKLCPPPPPPPASRVGWLRPFVFLALGLAAAVLLKRGIEYAVKRTVEAIDRKVLGVDITIGSVTLEPKFDPVVSVRLRDVKMKNPFGFEGEDMATIEEADVDFALVELLRTWVSPKRKVIDIKGIYLKDVFVLYETRSPEIGLKNSNIYQVVEHIRFMRRNRLLKKVPVKKALPVSGEPTFHLRNLRTDGFAAALSVGGVDLPYEKTRVPIKDLNFDDFMAHLRSGISKVKYVRDIGEDGVDAAELGEIAGFFIDEVNDIVMNHLHVQVMKSSSKIIDDTFESTAKALKELDADGDGNVTPQEVAAALWSKLPK